MNEVERSERKTGTELEVRAKRESHERGIVGVCDFVFRVDWLCGSAALR